ncbi:VIN3-like protein 2 isoform X1 [Typha angustifolia]|uniref:VIN3-like protein 2 isoform X1 n=2 Tax=Typha angustifolia TaxID=59011 RepID=UPI003C2E5AB4
MDPPFSGFVLDPSKCRKMNIAEKRELVRELSKWPESAPEKLQTWSRQEILEILCAEIGKERKYTGLTKQKMIEYLVKVVSEKKLGEHGEKRVSTPNPSTPSIQAPSKRQRKSDNPSRLPVVTSIIPGTNDIDAVVSTKYCQNLACRATLNIEDIFCRRCSCCICHKYDDNKDPSLWLFCSSEVSSQENSCSLSCHLECALKHERAGIMKNGQCKRLDGRYYCTYCGKENDLLGCWKKQLMIAKDARRVDVLYYRLSLSHKLLILTEKYKNLHEIVDTAMTKLEAEIGPTNGMPAMARGIVNRLSVGSEVQRLCARAVESLESMLSSAALADPQIDEANLLPSCFIKFEDISPTTLTVVLDSEPYAAFSEEVAGFNLWHRKADIAEYPSEPTYTVHTPKRRFLVRELAPATEYMFKVVGSGKSKEFGPWESRVRTKSFLKNDIKALVQKETRTKPHWGSPKTNSSSLSNPSSEGDESNNSTIAYADLNKSPESDPGYCENPEIVISEKLFDQSCKPTYHSEKTNKGTISGTKGAGQEETPGISCSALDEGLDSITQMGSHRDSANSVEQNEASNIRKLGNESNVPISNEMVIVPYSRSDSTLPVTPCKLESGKDSFGKSSKVKSASNVLDDGTGNPEREPGSSSKKRIIGKLEDLCNKDGSEGAYEYCVKVIRWLERESYIETNFRVKFLTWFSLRANPQEQRVVSVYVDTLIDDPASLAGQLVDTFSEAIYGKRPLPVTTGFCMKLWH